MGVAMAGSARLKSDDSFQAPSLPPLADALDRNMPGPSMRSRLPGRSALGILLAVCARLEPTSLFRASSATAFLHSPPLLHGEGTGWRCRVGKAPVSAVRDRGARSKLAMVIREGDLARREALLWGAGLLGGLGLGGLQSAVADDARETIAKVRRVGMVLLCDIWCFLYGCALIRSGLLLVDGDDQVASGLPGFGQPDTFFPAFFEGTWEVRMSPSLHFIPYSAEAVCYLGGPDVHQ
jgi:hypothetical protein